MFNCGLTLGIFDDDSFLMLAVLVDGVFFSSVESVEALEAVVWLV